MIFLAQMAFKMSQEGPTVSLDITDKLWNERTFVVPELGFRK